MKFTIGKAELLRGVGRIQSIVEKRNTMPILDNVYLDAQKSGKDGTLELAATDLEVGIRSIQPADVKKPGKLTVSAKKLYEILRELPEEPIQLEATPNFVTHKSVRAPVVTLSASSSPERPVEGRIVVVPNADPGFDWLFSRRIAGLVTMYGGRNSHMAIRTAELGLPAAIGVGELRFEKLARAEVIEMDCASQVIRVVR